MNQKTTLHRLFQNSVRLIWCVVAIAAAQVQAQEYQAFTVLGTSEAMCKPGIENGAQLQAFFADNPEMVNQVLEDAEWQGDANLLFEAIAAGNFTERFYDRGTKFAWTGVHRKGRGQALRNRIWAGDQPFKGFEANVVSGCQVHQIVIPHACCNVSLASVTDVDVLPPQIDIQSNFENVTICADSGNQAVISDDTGSERTVPLDAAGCWNGRVSAGAINVAVTNENECGSASSNASHLVSAAPVPAAAAAAVDPEPDLKPRTIIPFVGIFGGGENRMRYEPAWDKFYEDYADVYGVKAGIIKPWSDSLSLFTQIGYLDRSGVSDRLVYSDDTIFWDVGVDLNIGASAFVGGGIGYWNIADSDYDDAALFIHGGSDIGASNAQWFVEGRVFADDLDDIDRNNMVSGGLRYLFK